jgi:putative ABC transport system substrate-binding protein
VRRRQLARLSASAAGLALISSACALLPSQRPRRIPVVGYLSPGPREAYAEVVDAFLQGLRDLGYEEGRTIGVEWRFSPPGTQNQFATDSADLVRTSVDLILAYGSTTAAQIVKQATSTIPIVAVNVSRPVESGLAASLARPGCNLTALSAAPPGQSAKSVDLLRDMVPGLSHLVFLLDGRNTINSSGSVLFDLFKTAAESVGIQAERIDLQSADDLEAAFESPAMARAQAFLTVTGPLLPVQPRLAQLAIQHQLPGIANGRSFAEAGLLMHYGSNQPAIARRAATYVDKVLRGANPGDLPVEQPTVFDLVVNVKTLNALGMTIPPSVAPLVTEWIE